MSSRSGTKTGTGEQEQQVFFREVAVDQGGLFISRLLSTNFAWRCPACGKGSVSSGLFGVRDECGHCGSKFARLEGNLLISISLQFFLISVVTFFVGFFLVRRFGFYDGLMWQLLALGLVTVFVAFKPVRVFTIFLLWMIGFVYPDRVRRGKSVAARRQPEAIG